MHTSRPNVLFEAKFPDMSNHVLKEQIKNLTPTEEDEASNEEEKEMNNVELNALQYAAGYVLRNLQKLRKSANPLRRQLLVCLWDLLDEAEGGTADDWLKIIDRGGLTRVNEMTFQVFVVIERKLRAHLKVASHYLDLATGGIRG